MHVVFLLPWKIILDIGAVHSVDPLLIASIIIQESHGQRCATRYEPHYKWLVEPERFAKQLKITLETEIKHQKTSWGMMQIMLGTARDLYFMGYGPELCEPEKGINYGTKYLKKHLEKYRNKKDAIAAYNAGSPRKINGRYENQHYVDKVYSNYQALQKLSRFIDKNIR